MATTPWVRYARKFLGVMEIKGRKHNKTIVDWWRSIGRPYRDDETPYCGGYVGHVMAHYGFQLPKTPEGARNWLKFGRKLDKPIDGCVVVFWRGKKRGWMGHVAIVTGITPGGNLMCIGANQDDRCSEIPFSKLRVLGYRWPNEVKPHSRLSKVNAKGRFSKKES